MPQQEVSVFSGFTEPADHIFYQLSNGSTSNAIGDYSGAVSKFVFAPESGRVAEIERMIVYVSDVGTFPSNKYGWNLVLTNGIKVYVRDANDDIMLDLTAGHKIVKNADWSAMCYDVDFVDGGAGEDSMAVRWTFAKSGAPLYLKGRVGHYLSVELNDDFSDLVEHHFTIQGIYRK